MPTRTPLALLALAALTAGPAAAPAQNRPGVVQATAVEVRCGPSAGMPVAGQLQRGQAVEVVREEQGWLAVVSPPGSVSWIADRFLDVIDATGGLRRAKVIGEAPVPVRLGDASKREPLAVQQLFLQPGTIVVVTGEKVTADGTTWWPIEPPATEVRYVPADAVAVGPAPSGPATTAQKSAGKPEEPLLWTQADQAEKAGNFGEAMQLYRKLAAQTSQPGGDHEMTVRCYNRIASIQDRLKQIGSPAAGPESPARTTAGPGNATGAVQPAAARGPAPTPAAGEQQAYSGWLQRTNVPIDGAWAHALVDQRGSLILYVTAAPGVNLDYYVGSRPVEVIGQLLYRKDLRGWTMTVSQVNRPR